MTRLFDILQILLLLPSSSLLVLVMGIPEIRWVEILNNNGKKNTKKIQTASQQDHHHHHHDATSSIATTADNDGNDFQELYIQQSLDHFRSQDDRTFSQRYFYTDRFVVASHNNNINKNQQQQQQPPPQHRRQEFAFICVGGEGPALGKSVLIDSVHCSGDMLELAKILYTQYNTNVHLYALEHRYYGKSYPTCFSNNDNTSSSNPVSNENLVYLSSRQALADLSNFVSTMNAAEHCNCNCSSVLRWVTFGGSYPGMLAAWARLQFPHLIHAAVSNSAPIQAQLDFPQYNIHAGWDLSYPKVGGSQTCLDIVTEGHAELARRVLDPALHVEIAQDFNLCNATSLMNPKNVQLFLGDGVYGPGAQGNDPSCHESSRCNIAQKCQALIDAKTRLGLTSYETLRWIVQQDRQQQHTNQKEGECTVLDWQGTLDYMANYSQFNMDDDDDEGFRSWIWQTCTEFGFYQTCEVESDCPYGRGWHNVSQDFEICEYAFNVSRTRVIQAVQETLNYYGGWNLKATRVLSVNGNVDPWSELALIPGRRGRVGAAVRQQRNTNGSTSRRRTNTGPDDDHDDDPDDLLLPTWMVPGASHHFWTNAVKETDSPEVIQARQVIYKTVLGWLLTDNNEDDNNNNNDELFRDRNSNPATKQS